MPEAPRARPSGSEALANFAGHVRARPKAVFDALDQRMRPTPGTDSLYLADPAAFLIVSQGGWWYRGEYRVVPDALGSNVEHVILNVAQTARQLGRFTGRRVLAAAPADFEKLLHQLRLELE